MDDSVKLVYTYHSGNTYELRQKIKDANLLLLFINDVFIGCISFNELREYMEAKEEEINAK